MKKITFLHLLLILLAFSHLLSATAVPASRSQALNPRHTSPPLSSLPQVNDAMKLGNDVVAEEEEGFIERRMDLETQDYGGTGANHDHDPKSPGRA